MIKFIKGYNKNVPSWQTCLANFNESVINGGLIKHYCLGFFVSHDAHTIPEVQSVLKDLNQNDAHIYMNVTTDGGSFGRHKDTVNVFFWQAQGRTKWEFDNGLEYTLEPGDLIFVPRETYHNVIPLEPRIGISMSI